MTSSETNSQSPSAPCADNRVPSENPSLQVLGLTNGQIRALLLVTRPFRNKDEQKQVSRAVHHETNGSDDGLALIVEWRSRGDNHPGPDEIANDWQSYKEDTDAPVTIGIVCEMVEADGFDWIETCSGTEPDFEPCEPITDHPDDQQPPVQFPAPVNPFDKFSLKGMRSQLLRDAVREVLALDPVALMGQATALYGSPGTGKTLMTLSLLAKTI